MTKSTLVGTYVPQETIDRWDDRRDEMGISSRSDFVQMMVEAGLKSFERGIDPDEEKADIRAQRDDLRRELTRARKRINTLERQLHQSERDAILEYLSENPGMSYEDIVQYVINTASGRVTRLLDEMEGDELEVDDDGRYFALD